MNEAKKPIEGPLLLIAFYVFLEPLMTLYYLPEQIANIGEGFQGYISWFFIAFSIIWSRYLAYAFWAEKWIAKTMLKMECCLAMFGSFIFLLSYNAVDVPTLSAYAWVSFLLQSVLYPLALYYLNRSEQVRLRFVES